MRTSTAVSTIAVALLITCAGCVGKDAGLTLGIDAAAHEAYFPIASGKHALERAAEDGPITCASCHAESTSFRDPSCLGCHEHRAELTNAQHAGFADYRYETPRCLTCHPRGDASLELTDAQHDVHFPIADGTAHEAVRCSDCHTSTADRAQVTCTGCHDHDALPMQQVHGTMPGYVWETSSCRTCHARAENPGKLDHPFFPTSSGAVHEGVSCRDCHASPQDRSQAACTTCHEHEQQETDAQHVAVPDYAYDSGSCVLCHGQAQVPGEIDHSSYFPIGAGARHALGSTTVDDPPVTIECASCHQNPETRADVACTGCHAHTQEVLAPTHDPIPGYTFANASCLFCHPGGEPTGLIEHPFFPIASGAKHEGVSCNECHASNTNRSLLGCTSCHEHRIEVTEPVHRGMPGFAFDSAACITCHDQAQNPGVFDHEPFFPTKAPSVHAPFSCADCHASQTNRQQIACTSCHLGTHDQAPMTQTHQGVPDFSWTPASCLGCHPNGSADATAFSHPYFPIAAGAVHNGLSCNDCHTTPGDNTQVSCTTCHLGTHDAQPMATTHAAVPDYEHTTTACLFCHPNAEPVGNINHESFFPIASPAAHASVSCNECHLDANNRSTVGCAECHANDALPPTQLHAGIPGFSNTSPACLSCHPRAEPQGPMDHSAYFPIAAGTAHQPVACVDCHDSRTDRTQNSCASCHAGVAPAPTSSHGAVRDFTNTSTGCKLCHAEAQVDRVSAHLPFRITSGPHSRRDCGSCHQERRADKPWATDFGRQTCIDCHSVNGTNNDHNGVNGYISYDNPRCTTCHPSGN